jgi:outer membrane protein assembly factor BamA
MVTAMTSQSVLQYNEPSGDYATTLVKKGDVQQQIDQALLAVQADGYITAAVDSSWRSNDTAYYNLYYGQRYDDYEISIDSMTQVLLLRAGVPAREWQDLSFDAVSVQRLADRTGNYLGKQGYPFYTIQLDDLEWQEHDDDGASVVPRATLKIETGPLVTFDSIRIDGDYDIVSSSYYRQYLGINRGEVYNHDVVQDLDRRLRNLPFLELGRPVEVDFVNGIAEVTLPVTRRNASRFDFIIGVVPADRPSGQQSYTITGDFLGEIVNKLGYGERIYAQLRRLRPEVQEVDIQVDYPYLAGLPLGIDLDLKVLRNSETFVETIARAGLQFIVSGNDRLGIRLANTSNRILRIDTSALLTSQELPSQLDVVVTAGGLTVDLQHTDYRINPSRGWQVQSSADMGIRRIIRNTVITSLSAASIDFDQAYDTLQASTFQSDIQLNASLFLPPNKWSTIKIGLDAAYKYSATTLYDNELYRIGGNRRLRGFEEQTVLTDVYLIPSLEYRVLLDRNSHLSLPIIELGYFRTGPIDNRVWERSLAVGFGINFGTPAGIFNVSFVAGQRRDIPLNIQTAKIHFGYVSLF